MICALMKWSDKETLGGALCRPQTSAPPSDLRRGRDGYYGMDVCASGDQCSLLSKRKIELGLAYIIIAVQKDASTCHNFGSVFYRRGYPVDNGIVSDAL